MTRIEKMRLQAALQALRNGERALLGPSYMIVSLPACLCFNAAAHSRCWLYAAAQGQAAESAAADTE